MRKGMSRLLLIIPNLSPGGAQNVFKQHINFLTDRFVVHCCVFNWENTSRTDWPVSMISLDVPAGRNFFQKAIGFAMRVIKLRTIKKKFDIDITISHLEGADYVNLLSKQSDKTILWIHGTKEFDANIKGSIGWLRKSILMPWLYQKADKIVTVSKGISDELRRRYPKTELKLKTIYNGFDLEHIQRLANEEVDSNYSSLCKNFIVIITHCRLALQKNIAGLISIVSALKDNTEFKWVILGDGELREEILALCFQKQLSTHSVWSSDQWNENKQVFFLGHQNNPFAFLKKARLYVMTSSWEGFPLALCEAMVCGLPVMATDCFTGPREILAPNVEVSSATKLPYRAQYGILMPLLKANSSNAAHCWANEIVKGSKDTAMMNSYSEIGINRIHEFSSINSLREVGELIESVRLM